VSKSPAFQLYPAEFLADANVAVMNAEEVGAYLLLTLYAWRENGLPDDIEELAVLGRMPLDRFQGSWDRRIKRCFGEREDGRLVHPRLERERIKQQEFREKMSEAGKKGGRGQRKGRLRVGSADPIESKRVGSTLQSLSSSSSSKTRGGWVGRFGDALKSVTKGTYSAGRLGKELKELVDREGEERSFAAWLVFVESDQRKFGAHYFANNYGDYSGDTRPKLVGVGGDLSTAELAQMGIRL
jgi:uncharacterized protein YdaU (DUF1376 family)